MAPPKGFIPHNKKIISIDEISDMYYNQNKTFQEIANHFGLKSKSGIYERFKKHKLKARTNSEIKTGFKHSDKSKKQISQSLMGRKMTEENKEVLRIRMLTDNPMTGKYGKDALNYKGGCIRPDGYRNICINYKNILEHRKIWEDNYGPIPDGMHIHHIDKNKLNNDISNLQLVTPEEHAKIHDKPKCPKTGRFFQQS